MIPFLFYASHSLTHSLCLSFHFLLLPAPHSPLDRSSIIVATSSVRCVSYCNLLKISGNTLLRMASPDLLGILKVRPSVNMKVDDRLNINRTRHSSHTLISRSVSRSVSSPFPVRRHTVRCTRRRYRGGNRE